MSDEKALDAEALLARLAELRGRLPYADAGGGVVADAEHLGGNVQEFEAQAVVDGVAVLAGDVDRALQHAHDDSVRDALEVFYALEELARETGREDLNERVAAMRDAYRRSYGCEIPQRGEERR